MPTPPPNHAPPSPIVLRPAWTSTILTGPALAIVLVVLAWLTGNDMVWARVYALVFALGFAGFDHLRSVELTSSSAIVRDLGRGRTIDRGDVRDVASGEWWRGGVRLRTDDDDVWLRIGDLPLGRVSDRRLALVAGWAEGDPWPEVDPATG